MYMYWFDKLLAVKEGEKEWLIYDLFIWNVLEKYKFLSLSTIKATNNYYI